MKKWFSLLFASLIAVGAASCRPAEQLASSAGTPSASATEPGDTTASDTSTEPSATEGVTTAGEPSGTRRPTAPGNRTTAATTASKTNSSAKVVSKMKYAPALKGLPGTESKTLLQNPNRGFRLELSLNPATGKTAAGDKDAIDDLKAQLSYYGEDSPQLAQNYIYLLDYSEKDLDQKAFDNMQKYFDALAAITCS